MFAYPHIYTLYYLVPCLRLVLKEYHILRKYVRSSLLFYSIWALRNMLMSLVLFNQMLSVLENLCAIITFYDQIIVFSSLCFICKYYLFNSRKENFDIVSVGKIICQPWQMVIESSKRYLLIFFVSFCKSFLLLFMEIC